MAAGRSPDVEHDIWSLNGSFVDLQPRTSIPLAGFVRLREGDDFDGWLATPQYGFSLIEGKYVNPWEMAFIKHDVDSSGHAYKPPYSYQLRAEHPASNFWHGYYQCYVETGRGLILDPLKTGAVTLCLLPAEKYQVSEVAGFTWRGGAGIAQLLTEARHKYPVDVSAGRR